MHRIRLVLAVCATAITCTANADAASALRRFTGYTIVAVTTITGYQDKNGKRGDDFEGCDWDRKIVLDDSKVLTCATYSYTYSYRPQAVILSNGREWKMLVGDQVYDMRR